MAWPWLWQWPMAMAAEVVRAGWSLFGWPAAACLPISAPPRGRRWRQRVDHGERGCETSGGVEEGPALSGGRPRTRAALAADADAWSRRSLAIPWRVGPRAAVATRVESDSDPNAKASALCKAVVLCYYCIMGSCR